MATQILETNHGVLASASGDVRTDASCEIYAKDGSVIRGFFYAMLLNFFLVLTIAGGWELWRLLR